MYIGIVCPNFSGSTVVGSILHQYDGVQHVGEIWKIFSDKHQEQAFYRECGRDVECTYFSEAFKEYLRELDKSKIIHSLKSRFNANIVVSGDKRPVYYRNFTGLPDKILILIKNKYAAALSFAKRIPGFDLNLDPDKRIKFIELGAREYFTDLSKRIKWVVNNYDESGRVFASSDLICDPSWEYLDEFTNRLFNASLVKKSSLIDECFHYIGGNHKVSQGKDKDFFKGQFMRDTRYVEIMDEMELSAVDNICDESFYIPEINNADRLFLERWILDQAESI